MLATFGSPHGGASILNNSHPITGIAQPWLGDGCKALSTASFNNAIDQYWLLANLINPSAIANFSSGICTGLEETVLPILISSIRHDSGLDYQEGAPYLDVIDSLAQIDTMEVVTFYGIEEEPVFWRVLHSMTNDLDTVRGVHILTTNPFAMNDDDGLPNDIRNLISHYKAEARDYENRRWTLFDRQRVFNKLRASQNRVAAHWLEGANMYWKRIIGARRDSVYANGYMCKCINGTPVWVSNPADCGTNDPMNICVTTPYIEHYVIDEPNDGVVTKSSQIAYPGARNWPMLNTNHMQERNCEQTKLRLNELFNGLHGDKFRLYEK
ncbi:hypothetical protein [Phaeocystidibacter luteus]|uniref:Uncharacterized protein n=1 Tax=Phaeocystidibacter luteus TaxID=911197 RepID=A0A6N6RDX4_9FLAO|nr:hypothetical protein [Phaeocystidibacter luteus]KAB2807677.1 hypothetical protein F8C67_11595 [Phaeocystidibacter luteus]